MKNFQEKEIKDLSSVTGGLDIYLTVKIENAFDGIKGNTVLVPDCKIEIK
jgi:hypothetical protein